MDNLLVAAALASAVLHAAWNAAVKASADPAQAMTAQMVGSALCALPLLALTGLPAAAALPWMLGSMLLNIGTAACMLRGYQHAGFGIIYPMVRASSVLLVLPLAAAVVHEWPGGLGIAGVAMVSSSVALLALGGRTAAVGEAAGRGTSGANGVNGVNGAPSGGAAMSGVALGWTLAAGVFAAGYIVCDAQGVRRAGSPLAYGLGQSVLNALAWSVFQRRRVTPWGALRAQGLSVVPMVLAAMASYLLIMAVFQRAPIALAAALRDTSAIFAALIAVVVLKERLDRRVLLSVALATVGAVLIRLG